MNFYEKTKDAISKADTNKPRFHAFLKIAQSKPECCRQHLTELLIRPVQRLPSTLLLLDGTQLSVKIFIQSVLKLKILKTQILQHYYLFSNFMNRYIKRNAKDSQRQ